MNIRNAQIEDINKISKLMLQVAEIHSNARKDIFKEKSIEEIKAEVNNRIKNKENIFRLNRDLIGDNHLVIQLLVMLIFQFLRLLLIILIFSLLLTLYIIQRVKEKEIPILLRLFGTMV